MHDPDVVVFDIHWPRRPWDRRRPPARLLIVWHHEPGGHDSGRVCKGMRGSHLSKHNLRWAWTHRRHCSVSVTWPLLTDFRRWRRDRCDHCGHRFRWKGDARFSYQSTDKVWHDVCMSLRHAQSQLDDASAVLRFDATDNQRWRVEQRLKRIDEPAVGSPQ